VLFSSSLPGKPAYAVEWRTLVETWHCSINFFYVNQVLNWLGVHLIESVAVSLHSMAHVKLQSYHEHTRTNGAIQHKQQACTTQLKGSLGAFIIHP